MASSSEFLVSMESSGIQVTSWVMEEEEEDDTYDLITVPFSYIDRRISDEEIVADYFTLEIDDCCGTSDSDLLLILTDSFQNFNIVGKACDCAVEVVAESIELMLEEVYIQNPKSLAMNVEIVVSATLGEHEQPYIFQNDPDSRRR